MTVIVKTLALSIRTRNMLSLTYAPMRRGHAEASPMTARSERSHLLRRDSARRARRCARKWKDTQSYVFGQGSRGADSSALYLGSACEEIHRWLPDCDGRALWRL